MTRDLAELLFGEDSAAEETATVADFDDDSFPTDDAVDNVVAWINSNPPSLPDAQNHCAACGKFIEVYNTDWVYLADEALIHHGGKLGRACFDRWRQLRREEALEALSAAGDNENNKLSDNGEHNDEWS